MRRRLVKGAMSAAKRLGLTKLIRAVVARLPSRFGGSFFVGYPVACSQRHDFSVRMTVSWPSSYRAVML